MQTLEQLIDDPFTTMVDIFSASTNVGDIVDAAAIVRADFAQATAAVEEALADAEAAIVRFKAGDAGSSDAHAEALEQAMQHVRTAIEAARAWGNRYRPWRIALDKLDKWLHLLRVLESN